VATEPANRAIIQLLRYAISPEKRDELVEPVLASPVAGLDPYALRQLRREARRRDTTVLRLVHEGELGGLPADVRATVETFREIVGGLEERCPVRPPDEVFFWL